MEQMAKKKNSTNEQYTLLYLVLTVLIGVGIGYIYGGFMVAQDSGYLVDEAENSLAQEQMTDGNPDSLDELEELEVSIDDDPRLGALSEEEADVIIVEFSDYQCPFCKEFFDQSFKELKEEYMDTGEVLYVFRDFPLETHPQAVPAAIYANCAGEQDHYWEMHDELFSHQEDWSYHDNAEEIFMQYAEKLELDIEDFALCIEDRSGKQLNEIQADQSHGSRYGVQFTPTFFINGKKIVGAQPTDTFRALIERELAEQKELEVR